MKQYALRLSISLSIIFTGLLALISGQFIDSAHAQQPTVAVATVTGTDIGPYIIVNADQPQINVRSGPGVGYPNIGILVTAELAPAIGRSVGGEWIEIAYVAAEGGIGWVYAPLVTLYDAPGGLPIIEPPSTPTPRVTPTIDPTLAAEFVLEIPATRLPTFTAVAPLDIPEFTQQGTGRVGGLPIGMFITGIGLMGLFGAAVTYLRER